MRKLQLREVEECCLPTHLSRFTLVPSPALLTTPQGRRSRSQPRATAPVVTSGPLRHCCLPFSCALTPLRVSVSPLPPCPARSLMRGSTSNSAAWRRIAGQEPPHLPPSPCLPPVFTPAFTPVQPCLHLFHRFLGEMAAPCPALRLGFAGGKQKLCGLSLGERWDPSNSTSWRGAQHPVSPPKWL